LTVKIPAVRLPDTEVERLIGPGWQPQVVTPANVTVSGNPRLPDHFWPLWAAGVAGPLVVAVLSGVGALPHAGVLIPAGLLISVANVYLALATRGYSSNDGWSMVGRGVAIVTGAAVVGAALLAVVAFAILLVVALLALGFIAAFASDG